MKKLAAWVVTVPFLIAFGLVLVIFDLAGRLVRPFSLTGFEWVMGGLQWTMVGVLRAFGTHIEIERSPAIRPRTGYVVISNHQSMFDIALIGAVLFSNLPKYVAKVELGRWIPSISLNLKRGGHALIERDNARQALEEISAFGRRVQSRNRSAVIFPEGTRSEDGVLKPFKRAGARALLDSADHLPVIPVAVEGSWRLNKMVPYRPGSRVKITLGDPIPRAPDDAAECLRRAQEWIKGRLAPAPV